MSELALKLIAENKKTKATTLDLGNCGLTEVPEEIGELVWVEELILSSEWNDYNVEKKQWQSKKSQNEGEHNHLSFLPPTLPQLQALRKLVIAGNSTAQWALADLSPLAHLNSLQQLSCDNTQVADLSPLAQLNSLQILYCSNTQVADLSPLAQLNSLQILSCYNTQVADLSPLAQLNSLQILYCSNTQVADLSPLAQLNSLQQLYCSNTQVADLSPLAQLNSLQQLSCDNTQVADLSPLAQLNSLQQLSCDNTQVADLSPLAQLNSLQQLSCDNTQVADLSPLAQLNSLQQLYCDNTQVADLSPLAQLNSLQQLSCDNTQVADLSPLAQLNSLQQLSCDNTQVADLSPLAQLNSLQQLSCDNTQVADLSPILSLIEKGCYLSASDCPFVTPPPEIVEQGNKAILKYFEEVERAKKTGSLIRLAEAKCLILGEGGAGKTSLTRKLLDASNALPAEKETTKGINVHPHDLTLADGSVFRLNIWDFGGQEIYHATHQFFLTKRSLYLLLDDTRKDEKTVNDPIFNYWLQIAELYGGGSPLLIIQNEKGDRSKELDLRGMQGRFGFVKDAKAVNLLTCRGLDKVQEAIEFWIKQLPHIGEEQPKAWLDVRRELERLALEEQRDHISLEEYYRICAQHTIPERDRALFLSGYLHDFGAFLHFQDHPLLRKILVLNNQWATDAVYKVLDSEEVKRAFGRFTRRDLATIWADDRYADQHEDLLALMEKFELCYKLPDEKTNTWLAPQLLSVLQPEALNWSAAESAGTDLQVRYEYEFMPKGLLSQHIVRMQRYVRQPELAWKSGVVFERADSQALVIEAWGSRNIRLRARGVQAKELLTLLGEDFDKLHERLAGLKVRKMIPCNCRVCGIAQEPHFYEYNDLARRKERGKSTVECTVSYEDVGVIKLLDGVFTDIISLKKQDDYKQPLKKSTKMKKVFISYSHKDEDAMKELDKFLGPLERDGKISIWTDRKILPGQNWKNAILTNLEDADLTLLLVSANFLDSNFINDEEIPRAFQRMNDHGKLVIPIILNYCMWDYTSLKDLQATPKDGRPIADFPNPAQAWNEVARGILDLLRTA